MWRCFLIISLAKFIFIANKKWNLCRYIDKNCCSHSYFECAVLFLSRLNEVYLPHLITLFIFITISWRSITTIYRHCSISLITRFFAVWFVRQYIYLLFKHFSLLIFMRESKSVVCSKIFCYCNLKHCLKFMKLCFMLSKVPWATIYWLKRGFFEILENILQQKWDNPEFFTKFYKLLKHVS